MFKTNRFFALKAWKEICKLKKLGGGVWVSIGLRISIQSFLLS